MKRSFIAGAAALIGLALAAAPAFAAVATRVNAPLKLGAWAAPAAPLHINTGGLLSGPALSAPSLSAALPMLAAPILAAPQVQAETPALPLSPEASKGIGAAVQNISENGAKMAPSDAHGAGVELENAMTGAKSFAPAVSDPDDSSTWYDPTTGLRESETSKIRKTYQMALSNPRAKAIKENLPVNTIYKVQKGDNPFYARTTGDDMERPGEVAMVIFDEWALRNLSPHFLASTLASMWVRHLYRDVVPQSAEKTYMEGSVLIRTFMELTGSTARNWVGRMDHWVKNNFQIYRHFYHWVKGFQYGNVRQGPYFKEKIMGAKGDPAISTDARGRKTLFQRAQAGEISEEAAQAGQEKFDQFVRTEQQ